MLRPELREAYQWGTKVTLWLSDALRERDAAIRERDRARDIAVALEGALRKLVALKDGPRNEHYDEQRTIAWDAARRVLAALDPDPADRGTGGRTA